MVVAADKSYASDSGKAYPADVGLAEEVFNGAYQSTHFFISTYQNAVDQEKAAEIFRSCPSSLEFLADLNAAGVIPTREYLGFVLMVYMALVHQPLFHIHLKLFRYYHLDQF